MKLCELYASLGKPEKKLTDVLGGVSFISCALALGLCLCLYGIYAIMDSLDQNELHTQCHTIWVTTCHFILIYLYLNRFVSRVYLFVQISLFSLGELLWGVFFGL